MKYVSTFMLMLGLSFTFGNAAEKELPMEKKIPQPVSHTIVGNNQFAVDLYGKLASQPGNLFYSPFSISTALSMTSVGARETTLSQMQKAIHLTDGAHTEFAAILKKMNAGPTKPGAYQLSVANALWGQSGAKWQKEFLSSTKENYGAGLNEVDFAKAAEPSRQTINQWVEKETQNKIKDLLPKGSIDASTQLVLTNAIYFKGNWASQFQKNATVEGDFQTAAGAKVKAPLMHRTGSYNFTENKDLQALSLTYVGEELSMVVLLPRKTDGLANLEKNLSPEMLSRTLQSMRVTSNVEVTFPKFKVESSFSLNENLKALGMNDAFTAKADFSGMNGLKEDLFISAVVHKAFVDVNEEGTEAAAATGVIMTRTSAIITNPTFKADHPFVFMIRDNRNGAILFMGRVVEPK